MHNYSTFAAVHVTMRNYVATQMSVLYIRPSVMMQMQRVILAVDDVL